MLRELLESAETIETSEGLEQLHYVATGTEMVVKGLEIAELAADAAGLLDMTRLGEKLVEHAQRTGIMSGAGRFSLALGTVGVLTQYVSFWLMLGGAHAEAKAEIARDNLLRGLAHGAVLGGNDAGPSYVRDHFWQVGKLSYPAYPEYEETARNLHNVALVSGYQQGKPLPKEDKGRLYRDLHARMTPTDRGFYRGDFRNWTPQTKIDYYALCAAIFRRDHLE